MEAVSITFSKIEAETLTHRLHFLSDESELEELMADDTLDLEELARFALQQAQDFEKGLLTVTLTRREHVEALAEAIEGSTVHDIARDEASSERRSRQSATAVTRSLETASDKIEKATGRVVRLP
jgi:hypothetical protein